MNVPNIRFTDGRRPRWWVFAVLGALAAIVAWLPVEGSGFASQTNPQETGPAQGRDLVLAHDNTNFPLVGRHRTIECADCHLQGVMEGTPQACEECHWVRRQDDRYQLQLGQHCDDCHTPQGWKQIKGGAWDHEVETGFRIEGAHRGLDCAQCHGTSGFAGAVASCSSCHLEDYQSTTEPNHQTAGFPTDCETCHLSSSSWEGAVVFDHTSFPLSGKHRAAACEECHSGGRFAGTPSGCSDCHISDYNQTTNPNHQRAGFPTDCDSCHGASANTWLGAVAVDHDAFFELRGKHRTAECSDCHRNSQFSGTSSQCMACHTEDYNRTTTPNHRQAGFATACETCHGLVANNWQSATVEHTRFPLNGKHRAADCSDCHRNGQYAGLPSACASCHMEEYQQTNHQQQGFSTDCENCHGTSATSWEGATVNHSRFPLKGRHRTADCNACHSSGQYAGLPSDCVECHLDDYNRTDHRQVGFPTDCEPCHGDSAQTWRGASFNHDPPLPGAHKNLDCQACHSRGPNPPRNCYGCHAEDYQRARNPDHVRAGFPSSCENCHHPNHTSWSQADFNHDFPINSGRHRADCSECHPGGNFRRFVCTDCHEHRKAKMDEEHDDESGYVYDSQACYGCHPDGRE